MLDTRNEATRSMSADKDIKAARLPGIFAVVTPSNQQNYLVIARSKTDLTALSWGQDGEVETVNLPGNREAIITRLHEEPFQKYFETQKGMGAGR